MKLDLPYGQREAEQRADAEALAQNLEHESILRTIELLGTELIPQLERSGIEVDARVTTS